MINVKPESQVYKILLIELKLCRAYLGLNIYINIYFGLSRGTICITDLGFRWNCFGVPDIRFHNCVSGLQTFWPKADAIESKGIGFRLFSTFKI